MGIHKLNQLLADQHIKTHNTLRPNTVIIDGNNLIINRYTAVRSSYTQKFKNTDLASVQKPLLQQVHHMLTCTVNAVIRMITDIYRLMTNEKNIIIVFDPIGTPMYHTQDGQTTFKEHEEQSRVNGQAKCYGKKLQMARNVIELDYRDVDKALEKYYQMSYILNDRNNSKFMPLVKNELLYALRQYDRTELNTIQLSQEMASHVRVIQSISEADLVIYNIASIMCYESVLIYSMDTDYLALCSDLKNVYKTDITLHQPIYSTYDIWRDVFDDQITFNEVASMATMAGNDFTGKTSLCAFDVEKFKQFYQHHFEDVKRVSKLYSYIHLENIVKIVEAYGEDNICAKNSMTVYKSRLLNFEYTRLKPSQATISTLINHIIQDLAKLMSINAANVVIYDFNDIYGEPIPIDNPITYFEQLVYDSVDKMVGDDVGDDIEW